MWTKRLADAPLSDAGAVPRGGPSSGTVHVAAADAEGNLVSATISQGGLFGSCLAVPGTGIILGHGMCRFDPHPGLANSPGPGKRPLNNVCPLIIRLPDRDVAIGARGGRHIVSVAVQLTQRIVDFAADVYQAAIAPRIHTLTGDPLEVSANFDPAMRGRWPPPVTALKCLPRWQERPTARKSCCFRPRNVAPTQFARAATPGRRDYETTDGEHPQPHNRPRPSAENQIRDALLEHLKRRRRKAGGTP